MADGVADTSNEVGCSDQLKGLLTELWTKLADNGQRETIDDDVMSLCGSWKVISCILNFAQNADSDLSSDDKKGLLTFLQEKAHSALFEPAAYPVGWIHLMAFLSRLWHEEVKETDYFKDAGKLVKSVENHEGNKDYSIANDDTSKNNNRFKIYVAIAGVGSSANLRSFLKKIPTEKAVTAGLRHKFWGAECFPAVAAGLEWSSDVLQAVLMHGLNHALAAYNKKREKDPQNRSEIVWILPTLTRRVFGYPDAGHRTFQSFWGGESSLPTKHGYVNVVPYYEEIEHLENVEACFFENRGTIVTKLRDIVEGNNVEEAKKNIKEIYDDKLFHKIVKGRKCTKLCQLTCFVRTARIDPDTTGKRGFNAMLEKEFGLAYKKFLIVKDMKDKKDKEKWDKEDEDNIETFQRILSKEYEGGRDLALLDTFFSFDRGDDTYLRDEAGIHGVYWVADGEIVFFFLLAVLHKLMTKLNTVEDIKKWFDSEVSIKCKFCEADFLPSTRPPDDEKNEEKCEPLLQFESFDDLVVKSDSGGICPLFYRNGEGKKPTARFWSFYNFLERAVLGRVNPFSSEATHAAQYKAKVEVLYGELAEVKNELRLYNVLRSQLKTWLIDNNGDWLSEIECIENAARLPTFLVEMILREKEEYPRTLFLLPLMLEKKKGYMVPGAFLAGTYMHLESDKWPFVSNRHDSHLWPVINACSPLTEHLFSMQLIEDEEVIREAEIANLYDRIKSPLKSIIEGIKDISLKAHGIDREISPLWAGFLKLANVHDLYYLFNKDRKIEYDIEVKDKDGKGKTVKRSSFRGCHALSQGDANWIEFWGNFPEYIKYIFKKSGQEPRGFLKVLHDKSSDVKDNREAAKTLFALFKILVKECESKGRPLYLIQVLALCYLIKAEKNTPIGFRVTPAMTSYDSETDFNPDEDKGVDNLLKRVGDIEDLSDLKESVKLSPRCSPMEFLSALGVLLEEALAPNQSGDGIVSSELVGINFQNSNSKRSLIIWIECDGAFSKECIKSIQKNMSNPDEYHNLSSSLETIAKAVDSIPLFYLGQKDVKYKDGCGPLAICVREASGTNDKGKTKIKIAISESLTDIKDDDLDWSSEVTQLW